MSEDTPLMKQYRGIKEQYSDAILLFRLGDFYEMFGDDARVASEVLQIALTTREKNKKDPMPMCGIPYFASENYISRLVGAGHKVAICEQVEDARDSKGIVRREVVKVITPGTHTPEHPKKNNYIMAVVPRGEVHGVALADVSTGEFSVYETRKPLEDELSRYEPSEVVLPEPLAADIHYQETLKGYYSSFLEDWRFDFADSYRKLLEHFGVNSLEGYGCEGLTAAISAAGALVAYLEDSQKEGLRFRKITVSNQLGYMFLDAPTQKNLELIRNLKDGSSEGSLLWALEETLTPMGGRYLRNALLRPLLSVEDIRGRQYAVKRLAEDYELTEKLRRRLRNVYDLERLSQRVDTAKANARDLAAIGNSVAVFPDLRSALRGSEDPRLKALGERISDFSGLASFIDKAIMDNPPHSVREGGIIREGYHPEVDDLRDVSVNAKDFIASLEADEKKATGINSLKVGYNRIHGYYIEVTKSNLALVPERYSRRQTLVGSERFMTPELKEYESKVLGAEEKLKVLEYDVFMEVLKEAGKWVPALIDAAAALAESDFLVALAITAKRNDYTMPSIVEEPVLSIKNGRHPVLERLSTAERFIPNDVVMDGDRERLLIITGPNMAGKSTYMRQAALIVLMAQIGGFVPADEATIGVADRIFTRIGASDYLTKGQSTFMVEMIETANLLNNATERSLILLDEVGRGTSTFDGISIAWATAEHICTRIKARTLFATHYNELTDLSRSLDGVRNYNIAVKEWGDEIIFLRKVEPGPADKSYGIQVARLAGLPKGVIDKAREVLRKLESQHVGDTGHYSQMDLFSSKEDVLAQQILEMDVDILSAEEVVSRLRDIRNNLSP